MIMVVMITPGVRKVRTNASGVRPEWLNATNARKVPKSDETSSMHPAAIAKRSGRDPEGHLDNEEQRRLITTYSD